MVAVLTLQTTKHKRRRMRHLDSEPLLEFLNSGVATEVLGALFAPAWKG